MAKKWSRYECLGWPEWDEAQVLAEIAGRTTKPHGSGIGLALCRQIAEGHGGSLVLRNRVGTRGAEAVLVLPKG